MVYMADEGYAYAEARTYYSPTGGIVGYRFTGHDRTAWAAKSRYWDYTRPAEVDSADLHAGPVPEHVALHRFSGTDQPRSEWDTQPLPTLGIARTAISPDVERATELLRTAIRHLRSERARGDWRYE